MSAPIDVLAVSRPSVRKVGAYYEGVLRDREGNPVWHCGHQHVNRDTNSTLRESAKWCAGCERDRARAAIARVQGGAS